MFGQRLLEIMSRGKPDDHGLFTSRKDFFVCTRKGKVSFQNEKSLRQESNITVHLGRKAKMDCRIVLGEIRNELN